LSSANPSSPSIARRGLLLVLSSPSGAGKTTLSRRLLERESELVMSVSVTTRKPRPGEVDGKDYHFISREQFDGWWMQASCSNTPTCSATAMARR
jgi:guanylate kinase